jgi:hypothetical protein
VQINSVLYLANRIQPPSYSAIARRVRAIAPRETDRKTGVSACPCFQQSACPGAALSKRLDGLDKCADVVGPTRHVDRCARVAFLESRRLVPTPKRVFDRVDIQGERHPTVMRERGGDRRLARPGSAVDQNQSGHGTTVATRSENTAGWRDRMLLTNPYARRRRRLSPPLTTAMRAASAGVQGWLA